MPPTLNRGPTGEKKHPWNLTFAALHYSTNFFLLVVKGPRNYNHKGNDIAVDKLLKVRLKI